MLRKAGDQSADVPFYQCVFEDAEGVIRDCATREPVKVEPTSHDLTFSIVGLSSFLTALNPEGL
jgi:hypothetical protein